MVDFAYIEHRSLLFMSHFKKSERGIVSEENSEQVRLSPSLNTSFCSFLCLIKKSVKAYAPVRQLRQLRQ